MPDFGKLTGRIPVAPLKLIVLDSAAALGKNVNDYIVQFRRDVHSEVGNDPAFAGYIAKDYRVDCSCARFDNGEAKAIINESMRGKDVFFLIDVMNHSIPYEMYGYTNYKSPDDHYTDLKRLIGAINGKAKRLNVIMPFIYEGRQHKRNDRESLDAAVMIEEMRDMNVTNFITFDAHDPRVSNASPLGGFDNFLATYQFLKALLKDIDDLKVDKEHLVVISPDEGALDRAVYFANVLRADTGMFYKRRDYTKIVNGSNPIVAHEFLGSDIAGKDVIVIDDMISSGGSMIDTARQLSGMGAKRVFICTTFGLFTDGLEKFDKAYEEGVFTRIICTNLTDLDPKLQKRPYFQQADMSKFLAAIIDFINHDASISDVIEPTDKIHHFLEQYNLGELTGSAMD